jgi:hypothetical protein
VAELADALGSGLSGLTPVGVRLPASALFCSTGALAQPARGYLTDLGGQAAVFPFSPWRMRGLADGQPVPLREAFLTFTRRSWGVSTGRTGGAWGRKSFGEE